MCRFLCACTLSNILWLVFAIVEVLVVSVVVGFAFSKMSKRF